jgi:hypothetical protein
LVYGNIGAVLNKQPILVQVDNISHGIYFLSNNILKRTGAGNCSLKMASDHLSSRTPEKECKN